MSHSHLTSILSRIPSGSLFGAALRLPLRLIPRETVVTVRSGLNKGLKWLAGSSVHGCWLGHYEQDKQEWVRRIVKPGMKVFDIGANAGFYTLAFSRLVGPTGHVWAFEPYGENANNLLRHLRLNNLQNVTLVQAAVSDMPGLTGFSSALSNSMGKTSSEVSDYLVPTVALDPLIEQGVLPVPDVIKMDVEGAEFLVLRGAHGLLLQRRTELLVALHGKEQCRTCLRLLHDSGFVSTTLEGEPVQPETESVDEIYASPLRAGAR